MEMQLASGGSRARSSLRLGGRVYAALCRSCSRSLDACFRGQGEEDDHAEDPHFEDRSVGLGCQKDLGVLWPAEMLLGVRLEAVGRNFQASNLEVQISVRGQLREPEVHEVLDGGLEERVEPGDVGPFGKEVGRHDVCESWPPLAGGGFLGKMEVEHCAHIRGGSLGRSAGESKNCADDESLEFKGLQRLDVAADAEAFLVGAGL